MGITTIQQKIYNNALTISQNLLHYVWANGNANIYAYNHSGQGSNNQCVAANSGTVAIDSGTDQGTYTVCIPGDLPDFPNNNIQEQAQQRLSTILSVFNQQSTDKYALTISKYGLPAFDDQSKVPEIDKQSIIGYGTFANDPDHHSGYFCFSDCSGFVNYVVMQCISDPGDYYLSTKYPAKAGDYTTISNLNSSGWQATSIDLSNILNLVEGSIFAWSLMSDVESATKDSGHVMFVTSIAAGSPAIWKDAKQDETTYNVYMLEVVDCSCFTHAGDTNQAADRGIGQGSVCIKQSGNNWFVDISGSEDFTPIPYAKGVTNSNQIKNLTQLVAQAPTSK